MKIIRWLDDNLEEALLIALLVLMTLLMGLQVFSRYILNASLSWSEELTRYLFIWSGFLSISYCIKSGFPLKSIRSFSCFQSRCMSLHSWC